MKSISVFSAILFLGISSAVNANVVDDLNACKATYNAEVSNCENSYCTARAKDRQSRCIDNALDKEFKDFLDGLNKNKK